MEATDLEFIKFHVEGANEVFEDISTLCHEFSSLFVSQSFMHVLIRTFKVRKEKHKDFLGVSRDLD